MWDQAASRSSPGSLLRCSSGAPGGALEGAGEGTAVGACPRVPTRLSHWGLGGGRGTGQAQGHGGGGTGTAPTHTFASRARQPSGAGLTTSSSLAFLAGRAGGTLDASGALGKEAKG